ncbi:MAG: error-prone DNA polymerase [Pyrinomonadaceae bacterium]|nr:error-prone DNA polymerase [Pyrinomonadaceae bacterium]
MSFFELHSRSAFSFLSSGTLPDDLIKGAADLGLDGIALLDRDNVAGAVRFHLAAKEQGIKAIIGSEITLEDESVLPLIPVSVAGYQNLCRLITTIKMRAEKGEHFATKQDIEQHSQDLICITGGEDSFLYGQVKKHRGQEAIGWLKYVFEDRLYIELQRHFLRHEEYINQALIGLAHKFRVQYFASNGVYYKNQEDRKLFDVFTCIKNHCTIDEAGRLISQNSERHIKSEEQMRGLFEDFPEAVDITRDIANRIDFSMDEIGYTFPDFPVPTGETMDSFLRKRSEEGAIRRYGKISAECRRKLDKELALIKKLNLAGYFLLVWDISEYAKRNGILSQGRGSAANSVVCYSLGITAVDPIEARLLFERFLSEERDEYPDIDIDLPSGDDREQVIQYVYEKYGRRGAGMTANVITYRSKSAAREVGKVFGFGEETLGKISKLVSRWVNTDPINERFKEAGLDPEKSFRVQKYIEMYRKIMDYPRHLGQHSGGMVISLNRLDAAVPLEPASMEGRSIIQWDKDDCAEMGIVKVDLLGLGMMACLRDTFEILENDKQEKLTIATIPAGDPKTYEALQRGDTVGMFQVESRAQMAFLPRSKPKNFYDIVIQVAIIRPGPIVGKMLSSYLKRREGKEKIVYIHPSLEKVLKPTLKRTLGVPLFQEQLLKIAIEVAGFTGGQAEELRRVMGFKRPDKKLKLIERHLREGMTKRGINADAQNTIVECIHAFSNYGFPESHAASFALLAYASAYLKIHHLDAFTASMLNNYPLGFYSPATLIKDAQRHGQKFKYIDVNHSEYRCTLENVDGISFIRLGFKYVKGLRKDTGEAIAEERKNGAYKNVGDLLTRVKMINKKEIRALSVSGALNFEMNTHRRQALWESDLEIKPKGELFKLINEQQETPSYIQKMNDLELIETDLRSTGLTIGKHPMAFLRKELDNRGILSSIEANNLRKGDMVMVAGAVICRQRPMTAKGVMFITLEDETGHSNFLVLPEVFEKFRSVILENRYLLIKGRAEDKRMVKGVYFEGIQKFMAAPASHDFH